MTSFPDHFSVAADRYAQFRPAYPVALFDALAAVADRRERAWDCATGNGQVAVALAAHFEEVVATDASAAQIAHARPHPRVRYAVAPAEASGLEAASVDLVAVGQALHWFDRAAFFAEAERVLRPGGVLAVWTYGLTTVAPDVDAVVETFVDDTVGSYWPPERRLVDEAYGSVVFPFEPVELPEVEMHERWTVEAFAGYLGTWSAANAYREQTGRDPIPALRDELAARWGDGARTVRWPLRVIVRRKPRATESASSTR